MDGLSGLDDEFDGLPFANAPAPAPRPAPAVGKPDPDDVIVLDSTPPPAPPPTTPRKRKVVAVDVTGEEPTRKVIELEEYLPIARPSPPKPPAALASATPPAPPRVAPAATTPPRPLPSAAAIARSPVAHSQPVGTVRASSMSPANPPHAARSALPPLPAPAPLPPLPSPSRTPLPPPAASVARPPLPVPAPAYAPSPVRTPSAPASAAVPPAAVAPAPAIPSAYSAADLGLMASIDALRAADVGRAAGAGMGGRGRGYNCGRCGQPKRGHVCNADPAMTPPPKAKKHKTVTAASSLGPARPPPAAAGVAPAALAGGADDDMALLAAIEASLGGGAPPAPAHHSSFRLLNAPDDGEERLKPFKSKPTSAVRERINRALSQKMFLISRKTNSELEQAFTVLGSIGNVYEVKICQLPSCSCPDFEKGNFCKHILFVYLKVLRVSSESQLIYQHALLKSELRQIFESAPRDPAKSVLADEAVQRRFKELAADVREVGRKPITDHCPVCYEALRPNQRLLWCRFSCGNNVHEECFSEWSKTKTASGQTPTCVYCRASWAQSGARPPPAVVGEEGYVNLGALQRNMPTERPEYHDWRSGWY